MPSPKFIESAATIGCGVNVLRYLNVGYKLLLTTQLLVKTFSIPSCRHLSVIFRL